MSSGKIPHIKSVETRYLQERDALFRGLGSLDRRSFLKVSSGAAAAAVAAGVSYPLQSFLPINVAYADEGGSRHPPAARTEPKPFADHVM